MSKKLKVLMTAYACEPEKGSEPAVGWGWSQSLAQHVDLTVITRDNHRETIAAYYEKTDADHPDRVKPTYIYYDPGRFLLWLKKRKLISVQLYFAIWKLTAAWKYRDLAADHDLVHHLTYGTIVLPGFWWFTKTPVVLGPIGGTSTVSEHFIELYGKRKWKEKIRAALIKRWWMLPWARISFSRAEVIACSNSDAKRYMEDYYAEKLRLMTEIGADSERVPTTELHHNPTTDIKLLWIGMVEPWKAWSVAMRAAHRANQLLGDQGKVSLTILGRGRDEPAAHQLAEDLEMGETMTFHRRIPLEDLHELIETSDAFVFSSIKDTSGTVVLEAMSHGKPLICFNHQGVGDITTDANAIRVEPGPMDESIDGFAQAMVKIALEPEMRKCMAEASRQRTLDKYIWERKAEAFMDFYHDALKLPHLCGEDEVTSEK